MSNKDIELAKKIDKILSSIKDEDIDFDALIKDELDKVAYPNNEFFQKAGPKANIDKWLAAVRDIYYAEKNGMDRVSSINMVTKDWEDIERYHFLNWVRFYEGKSHMKYKTAQMWYDGAPGYFFNTSPQKQEQSAIVSGNDFNKVQEQMANVMPIEEKKSIIEKQRAKIIGRLDSAEKLLRNNEGRLFAGDELAELLEAIYSLKKKVNMVNKISSTTKLYEDMIVREGNVLSKKGFVKAAQLIFKIANGDESSAPGANQMPIINPAPPAPPAQYQGQLGGLPSMGPGMPQNPPESAPNENMPISKGISDFLDNLDTGKITEKENLEDEKDNHKADDIEVFDTLNVSDGEDELLVSEAQLAEEAVAPKTITEPVPLKEVPSKDKPLEVSENEESNVESKGKDFDNIIETVFANITIFDIIAKLEDVAKIFKTREIPRQLSIVDMMLDSKGIAVYFPALAEAINKSLEANNYIATRLDDVLSKLQGSIRSDNIDLKGDEVSKQSPEVDELIRKLRDNEEKEKKVKRIKKEQEINEIMPEKVPEKETPEIDLKEVGEQTAPVQQAPAPIKQPIKPV
jgi:hypothetical protein